MVWPLAVFPGFRGTRPITYISRIILPPMNFTMEPTSDTVSTMVAAAPTVVSDTAAEVFRPPCRTIGCQRGAGRDLCATYLPLLGSTCNPAEAVRPDASPVAVTVYVPGGSFWGIFRWEQAPAASAGKMPTIPLLAPVQESRTFSPGENPEALTEYVWPVGTWQFDSTIRTVSVSVTTSPAVVVRLDVNPVAKMA